MIQSKKINMIVAVTVVFALIISIAFIILGNKQLVNGGKKSEADYVTKIFGTDIISIEIIANEADWQEMLDNATKEQYIMADVLVNGTRFKNVGIRPKGNSSLTQVASSESDRYSLRLQFNEYIKDQTCFGLESFVVNNMLGDNTYMKEYVSYELMQEAGVEAPCFGFADIKINGENWGLYLAVELYNDSFEQRVFGDTLGMLYNVKSMDMGGNEGVNQPGEQENNREAPSFLTSDANDTVKMFEGKDNRASSGGSLEYTDENLASYGAIFNNVVGKGTESDFQRVVQALKALSEGNALEEYFDVDQILRYLAAHTIVVNLDSYSSSMAQNYYIYERDVQITILPWDYNLAWGGFQSGSASSVINFPIDTPVSGVELTSRPLIDKLFENPEYLERYHDYLQQLLDNYFTNGKFEEKINTLDTLISDYVKNDATAFCTYEEYKTAVSAFITLGNLRFESVQGQLDGTVPSTATVNHSDTTQLVSAGDLNLSDLGSMMGGKGGNDNNFHGEIDVLGKSTLRIDKNNGIDAETMKKAMDIIWQANGEITDEVTKTLLSLGLTEEQIEQFSTMGGEQFSKMGQNKSDKNIPDNNTSNPSNMSALVAYGFKTNSLIYIVVPTLVLIAALLFVARFKKNY